MKSWPAILRVQVASLVLLTLGSFAISYQTLWEYAQEQNIAQPWLFPLMLDASSIAFSLVAYGSAMKRKRNRLATFLVLLLTALSVGFQVRHAIDRGLIVEIRAAEFWSAFLAHALAPCAIFWLLEVLVRQALDEHQDNQKRAKSIVRARVAREHRKGPKASDEQIKTAIASCLTKKQAAATLGISEATLHRRVKEGLA